MRIWAWLFLMSSGVFAANVEELQQQFDAEKSLYEQKVSALNAAKNQANEADQQLKNAESEKVKSDQHLKEEEQSYDLAVQLAKRKKQPLPDQAQQELSAAQTAVKQADQKHLEKQSAKNKADQNLQQAQHAVDSQADKINRLDKDLKTKRFEALQAKLEVESEVRVEMTHSCGEDLTTKACKEQGRAALIADAARRGSVELLQGVSEADFVAQKLTKDQVRSEFKALVLSHTVHSETVQDAVYKANLTVRIRGQISDSLRLNILNIITPPKNTELVTNGMSGMGTLNMSGMSEEIKKEKLRLAEEAKSLADEKQRFEEKKRKDEENIRSMMKEAFSGNATIKEYIIDLLKNPKEVNLFKQRVDSLPKVAHKNRKEARKQNDEGLKYLSSQKYMEAINSFLIANKLDPADIEIVGNLGVAYYKNGDLNDAEKSTLLSLKLKPDRIPTWKALGAIYAQKDEMEKAENCFVVAYNFSTEKDVLLGNFLNPEKYDEVKVPEVKQAILGAIKKISSMK